jgi:hypothetical protein
MDQWSSQWIAILKDAGSMTYGDLPGSSSSPTDAALKSLVTAMGSKRASNPKYAFKLKYFLIIHMCLLQVSLKYVSFRYVPVRHQGPSSQHIIFFLT